MLVAASAALGLRARGTRRLRGDLLLASLALSRVVAALLFATEPTDPATFAATVLLLGTVALVAGYIPARQASRVGPMIALRHN